MNETKSAIPTVRFTYYPDYGYKCNRFGDQDGEYVKLSDHAAALEAKERALSNFQHQLHYECKKHQETIGKLEDMEKERDTLKAGLDQSKRLHKEALEEGWALSKEVDTLKAEMERLCALPVNSIYEEIVEGYLLGEARAYLTNATMDDDSLMAAIRVFLQDPDLARVMGEVGK